LVESQDEVVDPSYDCYKLNFTLQCKACSIPLNDDYTTNWENRKAVPQNKMIIINNPHNPTGKILRHSDFDSKEQYGKIS
jgi:methionine aminotransferase